MTGDLVNITKIIRIKWLQKDLNNSEAPQVVIKSRVMYH